MNRIYKQRLDEMMSKIPSSNNGQDIDTQLLRIAIVSELDAINLYEQLAELATDEETKKMLKDVAKEEKVHVGEFQAQLKELDKETGEGLEDGAEEEEQQEDENEDMNEARKRLYGKTSVEGLNEMREAFKKLIK